MPRFRSAATSLSVPNTVNPQKDKGLVLPLSITICCPDKAWAHSTVVSTAPAIDAGNVPHSMPSTLILAPAMPFKTLSIDTLVTDQFID